MNNIIFHKVVVVVVFLLLLSLLQENCNVLVSHEYNEHTRQSMAAMSEKEMSFELIEVRTFFNKLMAVQRSFFPSIFLVFFPCPSFPSIS